MISPAADGLEMTAISALQESATVLGIVAWPHSFLNKIWNNGYCPLLNRGTGARRLSQSLVASEGVECWVFGSYVSANHRGFKRNGAARRRLAEKKAH